jgi:hypothetical protein
MIDKRGKQICPKCGYHLLARENMNKIFCLRNNCNWSIEPKREEDKDLPEIHNLEYLWS